MPFGDWDGDGRVDPAEGWGTLLLTGVIEDGDTGGESESGGGARGGDGPDLDTGCGCIVAFFVGAFALFAILSLVFSCSG